MSGRPGRLIIFAVILFPFFVQAQFKISGEIIPESNEVTLLGSSPLANVLIQVLSDADEIVANTYTDKNGRFELTLEKEGDYFITVNDLDYESDRIPFSLKTESEKTISIKIRDRIILLKEVIISPKEYEIKGDTIIFRASAFLDGSERVVEDLLKKIPGMEVDRAGNVLINGTEVEKIMIEGDDFFEKGYKLVSKNMPVKPIDKVEVLKNYSHNHLLKGFEDSDKVALNLTLKDGAKNQWFGTAGITGSLFPFNHYDLNLNLMSFGKKNKHYISGDINNIGVQHSGDIEKVYRTNESTIGDRIANPTYLKRPYSLPFLDDSAYKMNKSETGSVNSIYTLSEKLKLKTKVIGKWDKLESYQKTITDYYLENPFTNKEEVNTAEHTFAVKTGLDWIYEINTKSNLTISSLVSVNDFKQEEENWFDETLSHIKTPVRSTHFDQKIKYANRANEKNVWSLDLRYIYQDNSEKLHSISDEPIFGDEFFDAPVYALNQKVNRKLNYGAAETKWIHKFAENDILETNFTVQSLHNSLKTDFLYSNDQLTFEPADFANDIRLNLTEFALASKYKWAINKSLTWNNTAGITYLLDGSKNFFYPKLNSVLSWKKEKNNLHFIYTLNSSTLNYFDRFNGYIYKGGRNFERKFEDNTLLPSSGFRLKYDYGEFYDHFNFGAEFGYTYQSKYIARKNEIYPDVHFTNYLTLHGRKNFTANVYGSYLFDQLNHYLKVHGVSIRSDYTDFLGTDEPREIKSDVYNYGITINSAFKNSILSYSITQQWNENHLDVNSDQTRQRSSQTRLDLNMFWNKKYFFKFSQQMYYYPQLSKDKTSYFADASFSFQWEKYKLSTSVSVRNIFDNKTFNTKYITDYSQTETTYKLLPRMILLGVNFNF